MLNKQGLMILACLLLTVSIQAQNLAEIFKSMPEELMPGISEGNKTMLLVDSTETTIPYMLGEIKKVEHGTDYIKIETSGIGNTQIKLLPVTNDSVIVCVIKTVCGGIEADVCDSNISFYTDKWEKLNSDSFISDITAEIFFDSFQKESENYKYALSLPDISPISAVLNKYNSDLLLIFNFKNYLPENHISEITPFLKSDTITLKWENSSFR